MSEVVEIPREHERSVILAFRNLLLQGGAINMPVVVDLVQYDHEVTVENCNAQLERLEAEEARQN